MRQPGEYRIEETKGIDVSPETILPKLEELYFYERKDRVLLLNAKANRWCASSKLGAIVVAMCDGKSTIQDICNTLSTKLPDISIEKVIKIADGINNARLFNELPREEINLLSNIEANITRKCNLSCSFCYSDSSPSEPQADGLLLSPDEWETVAKDAIDINDNVRFFISGGEPLMNPDAMEIVK